jgi:group I intron endonuclease
VKTAGIYKIEQIGTDRCYVGSSSDLRKRKTQHLRDLGKGIHHTSFLQRAWTKHGAGAFEFVVIEVCAPSSELKMVLMAREQHWIDALKPCFNTCKAAMSTLGFKMPRDIVERHREQITGRKLSQEHAAFVRKLALGLKRSDETKEKLRQAGLRRGMPQAAIDASVLARRGKKLTAEHIAKVVAANAGYKHAPEVIERMRASNTAEVREAKGAAARGKKQSAEQVAKRVAARRATIARKREAHGAPAVSA